MGIALGEAPIDTSDASRIRRRSMCCKSMQSKSISVKNDSTWE